MATLFSHLPQTTRTLNFAANRMGEIDRQIEQLTLEKSMWALIVKEFSARVCPDCQGEGVVMMPVPGCECDGPRQHMCPTCKGRK